MTKSGSPARVLALIPARMASERFPGKILATLHGQPLIWRVVQQARKCARLRAEDIWVAADDPEIVKAIQERGGQALLTAREHPTGSDRVCEALETLEAEHGREYDWVLNIQGDEPLISPTDLDNLIEFATVEKATTDWVVFTAAARLEGGEGKSARELAADPNIVKVLTRADGRAAIFSRSPLPRQRDEDTLAEPEFWRHIGVYLYRAGFLKEFVRFPPGEWEQAEKLEQLRVLQAGYEIGVMAWPRVPPDVNTPADLEAVRAVTTPEFW